MQGNQQCRLRQRRTVHVPIEHQPGTRLLRRPCNSSLRDHSAALPRDRSQRSGGIRIRTVHAEAYVFLGGSLGDPVTSIPSMNEYGALFLMAAIIFGAFISEDGATITAATLAASK